MSSHEEADASSYLQPAPNKGIVPDARMSGPVKIGDVGAPVIPGVRFLVV